METKQKQNKTKPMYDQRINMTNHTPANVGGVGAGGVYVGG
jgi:hypothetical protein